MAFPFQARAKQSVKLLILSDPPITIDIVAGTVITVEDEIGTRGAVLVILDGQEKRGSIRQGPLRCP